MGGFIIREMNHSDIDTVTRIHLSELNDSFLGELGYDFLIKLYYYMLNDESFKCFVVENNTVCGFISLTTDPMNFYKRIYKKHFPSLASQIILKSVKEPWLAIKAFQIFLSKTPGPEISNSSAELLSIAVVKNHKSQGVGKQLVDKAILFLEEKKLTLFFVIVNARIEANKFYQSINFIKKCNFKLHGENMILYTLSF